MDVHTETHEVNHHTAEEAGGGSLLEIDGTLLFIAGSFVIFAVIMQKIFYDPLTQIRNKRKQHLMSIKQEADRAVREAQELDSRYYEKIRGARQKVADYTARVMSSANQEKARILEEKKQDTAEILNTGRQKIQEEKQQSIEELQKYIDNYASDITQKILETEIRHEQLN